MIPLGLIMVIALGACAYEESELQLKGSAN